MTERTLTPTQLDELYTRAAEIAKQHVGFHPAFVLLDPVDAVRDWVNGHPQQALSLALEYHRLLNGTFKNSDGGH